MCTAYHGNTYGKARGKPQGNANGNTRGLGPAAKPATSPAASPGVSSVARPNGIRVPSEPSPAPTYGNIHGKTRGNAYRNTRPTRPAAKAPQLNPRSKSRDKFRGKAQWEQSARWASTGSYGGLNMCLHLVGGRRVTNWTKWEQGARCGEGG